jgi:hypothetical protein
MQVRGSKWMDIYYLKISIKGFKISTTGKQFEKYCRIADIIAVPFACEA